MLQKLFTLAFCLLVLNAVPAKATYRVLGQGHSTCSNYLEAASSKDVNQVIYVAWVFGYITGRNYESSSVSGKNADYDALALAMLNHCTANPFDSLFEVAAALYPKLKE